MDTAIEKENDIVIDTQPEIEPHTELNTGFDPSEEDDMKNETISFLETDWINQAEKHVSEYSSFYKDDNFSVKCTKIFVDKDNHIQHVTSSEIELSEKNIISPSDISRDVEQVTKLGNKKYKLSNCFTFNIDIDPESLPKFIESPEENMGKGFLNEFTCSTDIYINPTIAQFQSINTIYLMFVEIEKNYKVKKFTRKVRIKKNGEIGAQSDTTNKNKTRKASWGIED
tara:strand:+ start:1204 stop:1884 length:681 start_codon:yes stop_codon:yes gene_type:complete